jgi:kynurenine 3-monooxygenase
MACYLARAGWRVTVCERRSDPRAKGFIGGRSINLALSARGLGGLAGVGLDGVVLRNDAIAMRGRMIHPAPAAPPTDAGPPTVFQTYSANSADAIHAVSRAGLNLTLLHAAAERPNVRFHFEQTCVDVDLDAPAVMLQEPGGATIRVEADLVLGADGAFSSVRGRLQKADRFEYSQSYLEHGYKELHIPSAAELGLHPETFGGFAMDPNALHIWPRGGAMMIALPNRDRSFTCTLFWPFTGEHGLEELRTPDQVEAFFRLHYPDAVPLMPTLPADYLRNANGSLVTIRCRPWRHRGKVCLLGDAAHAIVPFYGQGMNAAFEDCRDLSSCLDRRGSDVESALEEFEAARRPHADAIADMAIENFVEMRDRVADPEFRYRKRLEQTLHAMFPERITPQYNLVSFSTVPYTEARRRGREVDAILDRLVVRLPSSSLEALGDERWRAHVRAVAGSILAARPCERAARPEAETLIDITPPVTPRLAVWPGDTPMTRRVLMDIGQGATVTLSSLHATVHLGAHADGPNHYGLGAPGIGERPLERYVGRCRVLAARIGRGGRVRPEDLDGGLPAIIERRVLIRTGTFPDPERWNDDFAALSVELVDALAARGVFTIGIDTPSVDLQNSKDLPAHHAMLRHDIAILEGLVLDGVAPGVYELVAAPLRLMGFDASPVRAVLRPEQRA